MLTGGLTTLLLAATALAAGLTGTWSPCGFSMLSTLGSTGHTGGRRTTIAACAAFTAGALAGGAATFVVLSYAGRALGGGATAAAAGIALAAAFGEARGVRVLPQVRRQVPEHWRRVMPLPLAGGLYGVLLGLGFTTFVLTLAVWALAGVCVALGDPTAGLAVGLAFGAGRALPVAALAPWIDGPRGRRYAELMAERPGVLRALRWVDGLLLLACAGALGPGTALAAGPPTLVAAGATDPTLSGAALAWAAAPGGVGALVDGPGAQPRQLGGVDPALGGPYLAVADGPQVTVTAGAATVGQVTVPGVDALAVAPGWLVARAPDATGRSMLSAFRLPALGRGLVVAVEPAGIDIGRPALDGSRLVVAINGRRTSRILEIDLDDGHRSVLRRSRGSQLLNPALLGDRLLYEQATYCDQRLLLGSPNTAAGAQVLLRLGGVAARDPGYEPGHTTVGSAPSRCPKPSAPRTSTVLWTTALGPTGAYVTELTPQATGPPLASIFGVPTS